MEFGGNLVDLGIPGSQSILKKAFYFFKRVKRLKEIKKEFAPHTSISFLEGADYVNLLSSVGEDIFFYVHGSKLYDRNIRGLIGFLRKRVFIPLFYAKADKILVVNNRIAEELSLYFRLSHVDYEVVPNFYDFNEIKRMARLPLSESIDRFFKENIVICISGRLAAEKGIDQFVKILPELTDRYKTLKLVLVGDGPEKDALVNNLKNLEISYRTVTTEDWTAYESTSVLFLGYQSNPYRFMSRSYMLVLPSLNEGMPNTIVEAMGLGVPVIVSDCNYGPRELLSNQKESSDWPEYSAYGILVPVWSHQQSYKSWVIAIDTLIKDSSLRDKYIQQGRSKATEFSKENMISKWRELLKL
ncbi:MAG: glycosyltransferase [Cyclobacteriaceae bacterium]